ICGSASALDWLGLSLADNRESKNAGTCQTQASIIPVYPFDPRQQQLSLHLRPANPSRKATA
ncbi:MAG: hypothetical protein WCO20_08210, partial [Holophagaceae bacterium]